MTKARTRNMITAVIVYKETMGEMEGDDDRYVFFLSFFVTNYFFRLTT